MDKKCTCNMCDIDFSDDNGYKYVLDELKATRARLDDIIRILENRIEKDAIITNVLDTDYDDEDEQLNEQKKNDTTLDEIMKTIAIQNAINNLDNNKKRRIYPWWSIYPKNMWFY